MLSKHNCFLMFEHFNKGCFASYVVNNVVLYKVEIHADMVPMLQVMMVLLGLTESNMPELTESIVLCMQ